MSEDLLMVKQKGRLLPAEPMSAEAIDRMKEGEIVTCTMRRNRNPKHNAKFFALLKIVFEAQSVYPTPGRLRTALKMATGLFESGVTVDGIPFVEPLSTNFGSMCQADFEAWYDRAIDVILTKILPGVNKQELTDRVNEILAGYQPEKRGTA
jgi:hypothetical protein